MVVMRRGTRRRSVMAVAATASGGETMAPRTKAAARGRPGTRAVATRATAAVVKRTRPTARRVMGRRLARKCRQVVMKRAEERRGGREDGEGESGGRRERRGREEMPRQPRTRRMG